MKRFLILLFILVTVCSYAAMRGGAQYDPDAARRNLSNVVDAMTLTLSGLLTAGEASFGTTGTQFNSAGALVMPNNTAIGMKQAGGDIKTFGYMNPADQMQFGQSGQIAYFPGSSIIASGVINTATGTAALPSYSFASDPNTGMYSPAADNLGVSVAGAEALRVNSAGEVLIATSTDAGDYKLQVNGNAYVNGNVQAKSLTGSLSDPDLNSWIESNNNFNPKRWGVKIDTTNPDPYTSVSYVFDAVGMTPATFTFDGGTGAMTTRNYGDWWPFINAICRPVMLNPDGSVAYELDHNDQTKKLDGTASDITTTTHAMNAMVEFKRLWKRIYQVGDDIYIVFSNVQYDPQYEAYAFTNETGVVRDKFYYSMFEGSNVSSKLRSLAAGVVMGLQSGTTEIDYADNNGAGWNIISYSQHNFIANLHVLMSKSLDSQTSFGRGNESGASYIDPGNMKNSGPFNGFNNGTNTVKTFYIEHFWGNYYKRCAGLLYRRDADTQRVYIKHSPPYNDTGVDYTNTNITFSGTSGNYIKDVSANFNAIIPVSTAGGSASTYYTDALYYSTPTNVGDCQFALVSGTRVNGTRCGAFFVYLNYPLSYALPNFCSRLSFLK